MKKISTLLLLAAVTVLLPATVVMGNPKQGAYVEVHIAKDTTFGLKPLYPLYYNSYMGYVREYPWTELTNQSVNTTWKPEGSAQAVYSAQENQLLLHGASYGFIDCRTIQRETSGLGNKSVDAMVHYYTTIHQPPTGINFQHRAISSGTLYTYTSNTPLTIDTVTTPYQAAYKGTQNEYKNAVQGCSVLSGTSKTENQQHPYASQFRITPSSAGDYSVLVGALSATASSPVGLNGTTSTEFFYQHYALSPVRNTLKVHVRQKPTITLSAPSQMSTNTVHPMGISAAISGGGDSKTYTWSSSNASILAVAGTGSSATLIAGSREGKVTLTCQISDEITKHNTSESPAKATVTVTVKKSTIQLSGVEDNGTLNFGKKDKLSIQVSEDGAQSFTWTSSNPDVADVTYQNGILTLIRKGAGKSVITGTSSTGNTFCFTVTADFIPETPQITGIRNAYGQITFDFGGILYDRYVLELSKNGGRWETAVSTKNKFASLTLEAGTYRARIRSKKTINHQDVYSDYSDIVSFTVTKEGHVTVISRLKRTKVIKAKRSSKKLKIKLKKIQGAQKYQIQVSKSKKFKKKIINKKVKKVNVTIKSRKKLPKKCYVRARAVKTTSGITTYGKWSKIKTVKK